MKHWLKAFGIEQADGMYHISFVSQRNTIVYLADGVLTFDKKHRIETDDFSFAFKELSELMKNKDFLDDLEAHLII